MFSREKLGDFGFLGKIRVVQIYQGGRQDFEIGGPKKNFLGGPNQNPLFSGEFRPQSNSLGKGKKGRGHLLLISDFQAGQKYWGAMAPHYAMKRNKTSQNFKIQHANVPQCKFYRVFITHPNQIIFSQQFSFKTPWV